MSAEKLCELYSFNVSKYTSLDWCLNNSYSLFCTRGDHTTINGENKLVLLTLGKINVSLRKPKYRTVWVLLDSGGSSTIMSSFLARKLQIKRGSESTWSTLAGSISTCNMTRVQFSLPKFFEDWVVEYTVHLTNTVGETKKLRS